MVEFKQILCPVDLSDSSVRPMAYAAAVAGWYGGQVTLLHVVPTFEPMEVRAGALYDPVRIVHPMTREQVIAELERAAEAAGIAGAAPQLLAEAGEPAATIVDQAVALRADLLVMGTHGRSGFDRLLLGSVTEKVLRKAPCPVLTVPPHTPPIPAAGLRHVLCPTDFSPAAMQAFGFAADLAARAHASLTLLHTIEWLPEHEPRELAHFDVPEFRRQLTRDAQERLKALAAQGSAAQTATHTLVAAGRAHREILRVADEISADLIVMGARGRGGPPVTMFGSTTQQVVRAAACPVMTVRETPE